jgi:tryptophan-rich sensory protein
MNSRSFLSALQAAVLVAAASSLGELATVPNLTPWYSGLTKPSFDPPSAIFGPVWTALYILMAFAFWRIFRLPAKIPGRGLAIVLFLLQLALNVLWSLLFFAAHSPLMGMIEIVPQLLLIVATIIAFWPIDRLAASCLVPLAVWVSFAAALNVEVWRLN